MIRKNSIAAKAFTDSMPVLMGYTAMGMAAGILLASQIQRRDIVLWAFLSSATSISGALQFALVSWISHSTALLEVALLTFFLNVRYAMYGLPLLEKFKNTGFWKKSYLIWTLTDETFALETAVNFSDRKENIRYCLLVALFDHLYWINGVTIGALAGKYLPFSTRGIDFAMTALFLVVLTDQCRCRRNRIPAVIGGVSAVAGRIFFSMDNMLIPAMILMTVIFIICRRHLEKNFITEEQQ